MSNFIEKSKNKFIFFMPYLKPVIWANDNLQKIYKTDQKIGESWLISAISNNESIVISENFKNKTLSEIFDQYPELFDNKNRAITAYPNLLKIIDAKTALSIQVHPNNEIAKIKHNSLGKEECWYILKNNGKPFVLDHKSINKTEAIKLIENQKWQELLKYENYSEGDFIYVPAGLIHAIPEETMVFELQQSSDITYRLYDYDRKDTNGNLRELHLEESKNALMDEHYIQPQRNHNNLIDNQLFDLNIYEINFEIEENLQLKTCKWAELVILSGQGYIDNIEVKTFDAMIITNGFNSIDIKGQFKFLINYNK